MELQDILKHLRAKKALSQRELAKMLNLSPSTIAMYETGQRAPDTNTIKVFAEFYGVSTDYLLGQTDNPNPPVRTGYITHETGAGKTKNTLSAILSGTTPSSLSSKEERDIAKDLEKILSNLESDEALAYNGEPMDDETKELMKISLENSMRLAKQLAKKKFTPEKYK